MKWFSLSRSTLTRSIFHSTFRVLPQVLKCTELRLYTIMHKQAMNHISLKTAVTHCAGRTLANHQLCNMQVCKWFPVCVHVCVRYLTFFPIVALCVLHCPQKINDKLCVHVFRRRKHPETAMYMDKHKFIQFPQHIPLPISAVID